MEKTTPKTKTENAAQKILKSIQPQEKIVVSITKQVSGGELDSVLQGVGAFTKCFNQEDRYIVGINVEKVILPDTKETSSISKSE
jgi:hypothetical protein